MAVRKKQKRPGSRHGVRASTIHEWACETMGYQEDALPAKELLIQAAGGSDVWEFITKHIRQTKTADSIRDNLLLHTRGGSEGGEWSELKIAESQVEQLNRELDSLHVATDQLQQDVEQLQADIRDTDHGCRTVQSNVDELQCQSAILTASYHHSLEHVNVLHEYTARLSNRPIGLQDSSTASSSSTRVVPESCIVEVDDTRTQVQHLLELMNTGNSSEDMEKAKKQAWTTVEGLLGARSGPNILSSLTITTEQNTREVREMTEQLNLKRDVEELRYSYSSMGELTDEATQPSVLNTVEEHIREAQLNHVEQSLQAEHTHQAASHSRELLMEAQRSWEELVVRTYSKDDVSLARENVLMEMEMCGSQAALVTVTNLCQELKNRQQQKREEMRQLEEKHKQISQFRNMMEAKQSSMRSLIKHNSAAKHRLLSQQTEVGLYIKQHICSHQAVISSLVTALNGAVINEVTMCSPKLARLRTVNDLSVHRLLPRCCDAPDLLPLLVLLGLHHLSAPDELLHKCINSQRKVKAFRKEIALLEEVLTETTQQSLTEEHLEEATSTFKQCRDNQRESVSLLSNSLSLSSQTMAVCPDVEQIITEWWEQPAMKLVHWVKVEDMCLDQWLDQWRVLAASYRHLHCS